MRNELSNLMKQSEQLENRADSMRVRIIRAHHNSIAVAYHNYVCCYRYDYLYLRRFLRLCVGGVFA